jgi:uncharacterized membrane protein YecN with MAPEG domain
MITGLYAAILALLYARISLKVIGARRQNRISLGAGPQGEISAIVSAHANFAAYVPLLLLLTYFLEVGGRTPPYVLHAIAAAYTVGRVLHFLAFRGPEMKFRLRAAGMQLTLWPLIVLAALNLYGFIAATLSGS